MDQQRARIVVGLDGSPGSRAALENALRDAARRDAEVEVVAAYAPPEYWAPFYDVSAMSLDDIEDAVRRGATETVREVTEQLGAAIASLPPVTITAVAGGPVDALLPAARGADLLVVGSRGRGGFSSMLLGSVSLQCVLHAPCPVTVIRPTAQAIEEEPVKAWPAANLS
jgi:nucleotide-binding universal stress UspA family protein